jgi:pimeloyl-ACP methyl ester carboxylesterase
MMGASHFFVRHGLALHVDDAGGTGLPVLFQHGLCGDARQTRDAFPDDRAFRRITIEMRGHGTSDSGDTSHLSIVTFANDVAAYISASGLGSMVVGGISMGAAIALRLACKHPELVRGLVLARPAWITAPAPSNMKPNFEVGALLARLSQQEALCAFLSGPTALNLANTAPDNLASLKGFFLREPQAVTAALLCCIAADGPGVTEEEVRAIGVPTLIIGHQQDAIHPLAHAQALKHLIAPSKLVEITPKALDKHRYTDDFHAALRAFLKDI